MDNPPTDVPPANGTDKPAKPLSQGFLDAQRALGLKWAIKRGTNKDGSPVGDEDKAWYEGWLKAHPPKPKAAPAADVAPLDDIGDDPIPDGPQPKVPPPPKADPDPAPKRKAGKASAGGEAGASWRTKYKLEFTLPNGTKLTPTEAREVVCVQGASVVCGMLKAMEDGLALVGAKPYLGVTTDTAFGSWVLTLDKVMPDIKMEPEYLAFASVAAIGIPYLVNRKKISEARKGEAHKSEREKKLDEMKRRTELAEREAGERARKEQEAANAQAASAKAPAPAPAPQTEAAVQSEPAYTPPPPSELRPLPERVDIHARHEVVDPMFAPEWE